MATPQYGLLAMLVLNFEPIPQPGLFENGLLDVAGDVDVADNDEAALVTGQKNLQEQESAIRSLR